MGTIAEDLALGMQRHQAGQLLQAEQLYREVLARDPRHADALHLLGVVSLHAGRQREAVESIAQAIAIDSTQATYFSHLGIAYANLKQIAEAEQAFRQAIALGPTLSDAHFNLANVLRDLEKLPEAIDSYRRAVALRPGYAEAHFNLGNALYAAGQLREAAASFRSAVAVQPNYSKALNNLGNLLHALGELDEAVAVFQRALAVQPKSAKVHNNLGIVLRAQGKTEEARARFEQALALDPAFAEAHANLGMALTDLKQPDAGMLSFERALAIDPHYAKAYNGLGVAWQTKDDLPRAMVNFQRALELDGDCVEAQTNLGCCAQEQGRLQEAVASYQRAVSLKPDCTKSHVALAGALLLQGDFVNGWPEYEWRLKSKSSALPRLTQPLWDGSPLAGRSILLLAEQGMGDTLQFVRYAQVAHECGGVVAIGCPQPLVRLVSSCSYVDRAASAISPEGFDFQAPLLSLPGILRTTLDTIPADVPYLFADAGLIGKWRQTLSKQSGLKIGIAWQGNPEYPSDLQRSIPLAQFQPLAEVAGVQLISLQRGFGTEQIAATAGKFRVIELEGDIDQTAGAFMDTAAIMKNLDLVITSDTSTVHLAGALGVPVWLATPFSPDWRWLLERDDSPWYPTLRLFRQPRRGDWESVFSKMAAESLRLPSNG